MGKKYYTIISEDEELLQNNIIGKVEHAGLGFQVIGKAQTGDHALELIRKHSPDLLITDIKMPVMNGLELLSRVSKEFPSVKTIIISGFSDFEFAKEALKYHVSGYLLKPVDNEELLDMLYKIKAQIDLDRESFSNIFNLPGSCTKNQIAETLREYIKANYNKEINLNKLTEKMSYSTSYLIKFFCSIYGMSPNKYLISLRIHKAKQLLIHNQDLSIQQIGEAIGYGELNYFSRIFKKYTGISPGTFRHKETD